MILRSILPCGMSYLAAGNIKLPKVPRIGLFTLIYNDKNFPRTSAVPIKVVFLMNPKLVFKIDLYMYFLRPLEHTIRAPITMVITHAFFIFQSLPVSPFNNLYISVFSNSLYFYPHVTWTCQINYINFFFFFIDKYKIWYSKLSHLQSIFKLYNILNPCFSITPSDLHSYHFPTLSRSAFSRNSQCKYPATLSCFLLYVLRANW